jgi:tRNA (guanosine-2'-O-)-methyltransferase
MEKVHLIKYLSDFVTKKRLETFNHVIDNRTKYITVVLEDIFQSHNASAVLRTCDCFGIQDIHVIENRNIFNPNPEISLGSSKWLNIISSKNTIKAINDLKEKDYRIVATVPQKEATLLSDFDLNKGKTALLFGTELTGLTQEAITMADEFIKIPMYGFTESFNISVSVSIILSNLVERLKTSNINWTLNQNEKNMILLEWLKESIQSSDKIIERYNTQNLLPNY